MRSTRLAAGKRLTLCPTPEGVRAVFALAAHARSSSKLLVASLFVRASLPVHLYGSMVRTCLCKGWGLTCAATAGPSSAAARSANATPSTSRAATAAAKGGRGPGRGAGAAKAPAKGRGARGKAAAGRGMATLEGFLQPSQGAAKPAPRCAYRWRCLRLST